MALTGLEIFKLLPKTNCKKCDMPTCLAFAMALAQKRAKLDDCPDVSEEAKEKLLSQEKNVEQAEESQRIAELNFAEGMITVLDISQAQTALTQARVNYSQALFDYVMALAALDRAIGVE